MIIQYLFLYTYLGTCSYFVGYVIGMLSYMFCKKYFIGDPE